MGRRVLPTIKADMKGANLGVRCIFSTLLSPGVKSTSQLMAASPQGAGSTHARDPVKVCVSECIPEERVREACQPPTSMSFSAHSSWSGAICTSDSGRKTRRATQGRCASTARSDGPARVEGVSPEGWLATRTRSISAHRFPPFCFFPFKGNRVNEACLWLACLPYRKSLPIKPSLSLKHYFKILK